MEMKVFSLKESELKQNKLVLHFQNLLNHIDSTRDHLLTRFQQVQDHEKQIGVLKNHLASLQLLIEEHNEELAGKEKQFSDAQRRVGEKERECDSIDMRVKERTSRLNWFEKTLEEKSELVKSKEQELERVQGVLNKYFEDIELKERKLNEILGSVKEQKKELALKEDQIKDAQRRFHECDNEVKLKEEKLSLIRKSIAECSKIIESREEVVREMDLKVANFFLHKESMEEWSCKIELKEKQFESKVEEIKKRINEGFNEFQLKEDHFDSLEKLIQEREMHLDSQENLLQECSNGLELKERELEQRAKELELKQQQKEKHFYSLEILMQEREKRLDSQEKLLKECANGLELKERELEQRAKELELKQQQKEKHFDSLEILMQERKKHSDSQEKLLQEYSSGLELKESELERRAKELELKQRQLNSIQNSTQQLTQNQEYTITRDGRGLQLLLNEHLKRIDFLGSEMSALLKAAPDPAKLVLDAMEGFYGSKLDMHNMEFDFDMTVVRRSCVILLQELKRISPQINPQVREEAMKLAADWNAKMTLVAENSLEVLGLLWLLTAFELTSTYDARELQGLLALVSQPEHATVLRQAIGITYKASGKSLACPIKIEEPESSPVINLETSSPNLQQSAISITDGRNSQGSPNEHLSGNHSVEKMFEGLKFSLDPAKLALTMLQKSVSEYLRKGDVGLEATVFMKNISMLKKLTEVLQHVGPHVKQDALKLAVQWKEKMRASDNSLEILCFLKFIATYGLLSNFEVDEILKLLGLISHHKQAPELRQTPGFVDKIPDFIKSLIERKKLIVAVGFVCTFELSNQFPPVLLLKQYVEDATESYWKKFLEESSPAGKVKTVDDHIADLRAVIECIENYNLDSKYPSRDIEIQIADLQQLKGTWTQFASELEQEQDKRKDCAPKFLPPEKRQAIAAAAQPYALPTITGGCHLPSSSSSQAIQSARPYGLPTFNHGYNPQLGPSSQLYGNYGRDLGSNFVSVHLSSSSQVCENGRHPARIDSNLSGIKDAGLHHANPFLPNHHIYGPN